MSGNPTTRQQERLVSDFHGQMLNIYRSAKDECGYNATRFLQMVSNDGGLEAARKLLSSEGFSDGLTELWSRKRLDISMEALVLRKPWCTLFTLEERQVAQGRLSELGYQAEDECINR